MSCMVQDLLDPCTPASEWAYSSPQQEFHDLVEKWHPGEARLQPTLSLQLDTFEREESDCTSKAIQLSKQQLLTVV